MRAQAEVPSARRPDTPAQFRVKAESAEVERTNVAYFFLTPFSRSRWASFLGFRR